MLSKIFIILSLLCLFASLFVFLKAIYIAKRRIYIVNNALKNVETLSEKQSESIYTIINSNVLINLINPKTKGMMTYMGSFPCIVGRNADISIINDPTISRRHIIFTYENGNIYIEDLGSANGTFVNGKKISSKQIVNCKDKIRIGGTEFLIDIKSINAEKIDNRET